MVSKKLKIIKHFQIHEKDTGSYEVQLGLLEEKIKNLILHLKEHKKDFSAKRSLLRLVAKRRKFLKKLKEEDEERYQKFLEKKEKYGEG